MAKRSKTVPWKCDKNLFASDQLSVHAFSIEIRRKGTTVFLTVKPKTKSSKTEEKLTKKHGKSLKKVFVQVQGQKPQFNVPA